MTGDAAVTLGTPASDSSAAANGAELPAIADDMVPRNTGSTVREEAEDDGRHLLYEPEHDLILLINESGRAILELCDGTRSVGAIVEAIAERYEARDGIDLRAEVLRYLRTLWSTGLVTMVEARP